MRSLDAATLAASICASCVHPICARHGCFLHAATDGLFEACHGSRCQKHSYMQAGNADTMWPTQLSVRLGVLCKPTHQQWPLGIMMRPSNIAPQTLVRELEHRQRSPLQPHESHVRHFQHRLGAETGHVRGPFPPAVQGTPPTQGGFACSSSRLQI